MNNKELTPYQAELLTILTEECGETVQEICKIKRFGLHEESHHIRGSSHLACLEQELGDIIAMIKLLQESEMGLTVDGIMEAALRKEEKVKKWMKYTKEKDNE